MLLRRGRTKAIVGSALLLASCGLNQPRGADLQLVLDAELVRLERLLGKTEAAALPSPFAELVGQNRKTLGKVREAKDPLLKLYRLREPYVGIQSLAYMADHRDAMNDLAAFQALWEEGSRTDRGARKEDGGNNATRGLIEISVNRHRRLREASVAYARISSPQSGLYYLAEAEGHRLFAERIQSLPIASRRDRALPAQAAVASGLEELEVRTLELFGKDRTSRAAVPISAKLKEARELLDDGAVAGALVVLVEARLLLGREDVNREQRPPTPALADLEDDPIALLLIAMAEEDPDTKPLIESEALPFYLTMIGTERGNPRAAEPAVTVTIVRWPYT